MSAQDFSCITIVDITNAHAQILNASTGYAAQDNNGITTLSSNNPNEENTIQGLLYVPSFPEDSVCPQATKDLIPHNVTTKNTFTDTDINNFGYVAIAPWTTPECVQEYLATMRADAVKGAIFFHNDDSSVKPPPKTDPSWAFHNGYGGNGDQGATLSNQNQFPVYALPSILSLEIIHQLSLYSGNMSQAPHANVLLQSFDPRDSVRLFVRMDLNGSSSIPSLWVFLIIVLAVLLALVLSTSFVMHMFQRRSRRVLSRRVAAGEVDLEALGIKRLNVPQSLLDAMPQYVYTASTDASTATEETETHPTKLASPPAAPGRQSHYTQPTCPICLDDFVSSSTTVRELPCNHIFHPDCIDPFLRENSSLCPVCKQSALPSGYCPVNVTNIMVRRERLVRRMRERNTGQGNEGQISRYAGQNPVMRALDRRARAMVMPTPPPAVAAMGLQREVQAHGQPTELQTVGSRRSQAPVIENTMGAQTEGPEENVVVPPEVEAQGTEARRQWLRQRLARRQSAAYMVQAREAERQDVGRPLWRRIAGRMFPNLD